MERPLQRKESFRIYWFWVNTVYLLKQLAVLLVLDRKTAIIIFKLSLLWQSKCLVKNTKTSFVTWERENKLSYLKHLTPSAFFLATSSSIFFSSWIFSSCFLSSAIFLSSTWITSRRVRLSILPSRLPMAALARVATWKYKRDVALEHCSIRLTRQCVDQLPSTYIMLAYNINLKYSKKNILL